MYWTSELGEKKNNTNQQTTSVKLQKVSFILCDILFHVIYVIISTNFPKAALKTFFNLFSPCFQVFPRATAYQLQYW